MMSRTGLSDAELVSGVLAGQRDAFSALVERYLDTATSLALMLVHHADDAQDIAQQAFFLAYAKLPNLAEPARFGGWLKGIVTNLARKALAKRTRTQRFLQRHRPDAYAPDPAEQFADNEHLRTVVGALDALEQSHREVVVLYYLGEMRVADVAEIAGRPVGTVKRMLAEARAELRTELMDMARKESGEYRLTEEQRKRLALIPTFPQVEPAITTAPLDEAAPEVRIVAPHGNFPRLEAGAEACHADYDHPGGELTSVTHVVVGGPCDLDGVSAPAFSFDGMSFSGEGKVEWGWRPYYTVDGDAALYCAKQVQPAGEPGPLLTPDHPDWHEAEPQPEALALTPGCVTEPVDGWSGLIVDKSMWEVTIGERRFECIRRCGGGKWHVEWCEEPVTVCGTEEFFLPDGRLLLWRRYNGMKWSARNPKRNDDDPGTYEMLAEVGVPSLEVFGCTYYLWYDQIPSYAIE